MRETLIKQLVSLHDRLVDEMEILNSCFGLQLLAIIFFDVSYVTTMLFNLTAGFLTAARWHYVTITCSFGLQILVGFIVIFGCCESVTHRARSFTNLLSNLALQNHKGQLEKNPHIMMHFIIRKKLKFTTYGGLTLNYRFMLSLIASCITYLMILLQFNGPVSCPSQPSAIPPTDT